MNPNKCDVTVVLDRSGSMATVAEDMKGGFDEFIAAQKKAPGEARLTLVQFDTAYEFVHKAIEMKDVPPLSLVPRGATALLDAVGRAIVETGERLKALPEHDRPGKVVFVIITDGEENSSREYGREKIKEMITHQQDVYKWEFVFLGANQDSFASARGMGINLRSVSDFKMTGMSVGASFRNTAANLTAYRTGSAENMAYSEKQKDEITS